MYRIELYKADYHEQVIDFLDKIYSELNWKFDLWGKHTTYADIEANFDGFWCMFDGDILIGTVALRNMGNSDCELKTLYLYKAYQGKKLGYKLLNTAIDHARKKHYSRMFLDSKSTSENALRLYLKNGFRHTERYNDNPHADIFMVLNL